MLVTVGKAGVAIDPGSLKGVLPLSLTEIKASAGVLFKWMAWEQIVRLSFEDFCYGFVNTLSPEAQRAAYEAHVVPETGRIFFQAAFSALEPHSEAEVNVKNTTRAPLLLTAGLLDHTVPPGLVRSNHKLYEHSSARTDLLEFPGRSHWIIAQEGWEEVATSIQNWLTQVI
jgi:pimeloyl-ACP methyl ester carboxylesterase